MRLRNFQFAMWLSSSYFTASTNFRRKFCSSRASPWNVMFFGSDHFSLESFKSLCVELKRGGVIRRLEVVTCSNRTTPVMAYARNHELTIHTWPIQINATKDFDVGVVASFGRLIPKAVIDAFPLGMLNVHGSLLPKWRGAAPVVYAVMNGDVETGITIMKIRPHRFDEGEIVSKRKISILPSETAVCLTRRMAVIGAQELMEVIHRLPNCLASAVPQPKEGVTYAPKLDENIGRVDFQAMDAVSIYNLNRALCGIYPLFSTLRGVKIRLHDISINSTTNAKGIWPESKVIQPGRIRFDKGTKFLYVQCCCGTFISIGGFSPPKKKILSATEFYNGYLGNSSIDDWVFGS